MAERFERPVRVELPGGGLLTGALELPAGGARLADLARAVLPLAGAVERLVAERAASAGAPPACARGCGACCRQLVTVSPAEAFMLAELLEARPAPRREELKARFAAAKTSLTAAGLGDRLLRLDEPTLSAEDHYRLAEAYFLLDRPCPFQEEDGACGIHPDRPALCREYLVSSPPAGCTNPFRRTVRRLPVPAPVSEALAGVCAERLRHEIHPIPLALAPAWAAAHAAQGRRAWPARALAESFLLWLEVAIGQAVAPGAS